MKNLRYDQLIINGRSVSLITTTILISFYGVAVIKKPQSLLFIYQFILLNTQLVNIRHGTLYHWSIWKPIISLASTFWPWFKADLYSRICPRPNIQSFFLEKNQIFHSNRIFLIRMLCHCIFTVAFVITGKLTSLKFWKLLTLSYLWLPKVLKS